MKNLPVGFRILHWVIIVNFLMQIGYGGYMVFFGLSDDDEDKKPLFGRANEFDFETMMTRRMYASETWIAISGLSCYLGATEILPRLLKSNTRGILRMLF